MGRRQSGFQRWIGLAILGWACLAQSEPDRRLSPEEIARYGGAGEVGTLKEAQAYLSLLEANGYIVATNHAYSPGDVIAGVEEISDAKRARGTFRIFAGALLQTEESVRYPDLLRIPSGGAENLRLIEIDTRVAAIRIRPGALLPAEEALFRRKGPASVAEAIADKDLLIEKLFGDYRSTQSDLHDLLTEGRADDGSEVLEKRLSLLMECIVRERRRIERLKEFVGETGRSRVSQSESLAADFSYPELDSRIQEIARWGGVIEIGATSDASAQEKAVSSFFLSSFRSDENEKVWKRVEQGHGLPIRPSDVVAGVGFDPILGRRLGFLGTVIDTNEPMRIRLDDYSGWMPDSELQSVEIALRTQDAELFRQDFGLHPGIAARAELSVDSAGRDAALQEVRAIRKRLEWVIRGLYETIESLEIINRKENQQEISDLRTLLLNTEQQVREIYVAERSADLVLSALIPEPKPLRPRSALRLAHAILHLQIPTNFSPTWAELVPSPGVTSEWTPVTIHGLIGGEQGALIGEIVAQAIEGRTVQGVHTESTNGNGTKVTVFRGAVIRLDEKGKRIEVEIRKGADAERVFVPAKDTLFFVRNDVEELSEEPRTSNRRRYDAAKSAIKTPIFDISGRARIQNPDERLPGERERERLAKNFVQARGRKARVELLKAFFHMAERGGRGKGR